MTLCYMSSPQVTVEPEENIDDDTQWDAEDDNEDGENTLFDMDEFVLQESTGYMLPTLRFLAIFHTVISLVCLVGYYYLKVGLFMMLSLQFPDDACVRKVVVFN